MQRSGPQFIFALCFTPRPHSIRSLIPPAMQTRLLRLLAAILAAAVLPLSAAESFKDYTPEYRAALVDMVLGFNARDWPRSLAAIERADKMRAPTTHTLNTKGAIFIEQKNYEEGIKYCKEALKLDPRYYPALFNLAEVPLMQKRYAEARVLFTKILDANPKDDLVRFRVFLTYLLEKNDTAARATLSDIAFPGDQPAFYYANAAWEYAHGNEAEAKNWITRGDWVFGLRKAQPYADALVELGWTPRRSHVSDRPGEDPAPPPEPPLPADLKGLTEPKAPAAGENK